MPVLSAQLRASAAARAYTSARNNEKRFTRSSRTQQPKHQSIRTLASQEKISKSALHREIQRLSNDTPYSKKAVRKSGRPRCISDAEDAALVAFVTWLERSGFPAEKKQIEEAAMEFIRMRNPQAPWVSKMWYSRWRAQHPELKKSYIKAVDKA
jgi:hypothetical protein